MAKRDTNNNDRDYVFANNENLEKQAELMQRMADDVLKRLETGYESIAARISSNYQKEYSKLEKAINEANADREKRRNESSSFKENLYTNILNQTGAGQKFDTNWKSVGLTIGRELVQGIERAFSTYLLDPIKTGFSEMSATYEREFTEIAGRMGTNRSETYDTMKGAIDRLMATSAKWAVDINRDLIPALREATKQGFQGDRAEEIALSNAIDKRIMPWLDTASDTWANLAFNLDKNAMQQIKGQQLLLQASESGNRLLQSGVINQLTTDIAPTLTNIDFNTGGAANLGPEAMAHMEKLVSQGLSPQEAYAIVQDTLKIWKDPAAALQSGEAYDVIRGVTAYQGGDYSDIVDSSLNMQSLAASTGMNAGFVQHALGMNMPTGIYRSESSSQYLRGSQDVDWDKFSKATADEFYQAMAEAVPEKSTATESWDTYIRNQTTSATYTLNTWPHGPDTLLNILTTLKEILLAVGGSMIGNFVLNKLTGGGGGSGKGLLSKAGSKISSGASKLLTGGEGFTTASQLGTEASGKLFSNAARKVGWRGAGLKTGGLVGGLAQGGSNMSFGALSGTGATAAGAATTLAGGAIALKGGQILGETISDWNEPAKGTRSKAEENTVGLLTGGAAVAGGGMALAAGLGLASGPIGWAGLIIGGLAIAGKEIYDTATYVGGASEAIEKEYEQQRQSIRQEGIENSKSLSEVYSKLQTNADTEDELAAQRSALINTGLLTEEDAQKAQKMSTEELKKLTQQYADSSKKIANATDTAMGKYQNESTQWAKETWGGIEDVLQSYNDNEDGKSRNDEGYIESASSIMDTIYGDLLSQKESGKELDKSSQKIFDAIEGAMADGYTAEELNSIIDSGWINEHLQSTNISPEAMQTIISTLQLQADTGNAAASEMVGVVKSVEQEKGLSYRDADEAAEALSYITPLLYGTESQQTIENVQTQMDAFKKEGFKLADYANEKALLEKKYTSFDFSKYKVGTPYVYNDQLAFIHQGEAVLTKQENEKRLEGLLPTQSPADSNKEAAQITANEVVNAIKSQTTEVLAALQQIINRLSSNQLTSIKRNDNESLRTMMPQIANTRNLT